MSRRSTLTGRVVLVLVVATIVPAVVVGFLAIRNAFNDVEREVVRGNLALIRALGASLDARLQDARRSLELVAAAWADGRDPATDAGDDAQAAATERLLRRLRREVPLFSTITITDVNGYKLYGGRTPPGVGTAAHTFGGYMSDIVFEDGRPKVRLVIQARSRTGELVGVFIARLDLQFVADALRALVEESRLGRGARLLVVDGDGRPVASSDSVTSLDAPSLRHSSPAVAQALRTTSEGSLEAGGLISVYRNIASYQSERGVRWAIILAQPTEHAYALAQKTMRDTIVTAVTVLALSLLIGVLLATRLTRPLRTLARRADAIAGNGDPGSAVEAPIRAPGEIGVLAQRLEEMARRIGEREKLQHALARGDRLASVGTMAASVAHEINNPLTTVLGYAKLLLEGKDEDHLDRPGLELIAEEAARMKTIIGNLLDYARSERAPRQSGSTADVNATLQHVAALLVPQLRLAGVHLEMTLGDALPEVTGDAHALQQVFVNLVQNAAQAMPEGGTVTIESQVAPGDVAVHVVVMDQGPGVPRADRTRIFEPFVTTKEAGTGTGLGLAVCKHLVTSAGGGIDVTDGPRGHGARFRVVLPIADQAKERQ